MFSVFIQFIIAWFVKTRIGKKVSNHTKKRFPLGYFLVAQKPGE